MPKKSTKTEELNAAAPAEPVISTAAAEPAVEAKKPTARKAAAKKKSAGSKTAAKKTSAKKSPKKSTGKRSVPAQHATEPSDEDIRLRAYFIAERRVQLSLGGDPANDWIQARQELIAELSNGAANGNGSH